MDRGLVDVAVVGTAGRTAEQLHDLSSHTLEWMEQVVLAQIAAWGLDLARVRLVSGGAAWADHVAVLMFLRHIEAVGGLRLVTPCRFDQRRLQFEDNGHFGYTNPGRALNMYHRQHSRATGRDTFIDITTAIALGAEMDAGAGGFFARNTVVARCPYMIAFTFSPGDAPDKAHSPGTLDTWTKCRGTKVHHTIRRDDPAPRR